jgi:hypothetical protein
MLRRILTTILALAILGYGTAWAFAGQGVDAAEHTLAAVHWTSTDADHADTGCDHRCHANAHLLGLHQAPPTLSPRGSDRPVPVAAYPLSSLPPALPLKPPRS